VAIGFVGVIVMLVPHLEFGGKEAGLVASAGAIFAVIAVFCNAGTVIQTRRLTQSETTPSIVFYFSLICAIAGALSLPFEWYTPTWLELVGLISLGLLGGLAHIFLTESYRFAAASTVAPFDYSTMIWAIILGYYVFGEIPTGTVYVGSAIVAAAGLFVIWRERQLGLQRRREVESPPSRT
jgi:drug/metabolite transporter (DMT)-like permease